MKAKVIETGEIVNVTPNPTWYKESGQGPDRREWDEDELEFLGKESIIIDRKMAEDICRYCENQAIYDKLVKYGDFYYELKRRLI